ncbi:hypothetical protein SAMN04488505_10719 [Chitinophaga rupis]|uniref:Uncharacterized protein n=1 Tax=Chitinophaga rupis TaxID=573321 RepID=A0A1H8C7C3_9BACT|nr:hypothetical protein SAMN04488505_10719 [Chitinophaga rupis]
MKVLSCIFLMLTLPACDGIRGWFPGYTDPKPSQAKPDQGCNKDLTVHYKNNCSKQLIMYFTEITPGSSFQCEGLGNLGMIVVNETKSVTVHKGKIGYLVFAEDPEGRCNSAHRKSEAWVNCEQSNNEEATFNVCR